MVKEPVGRKNGQSGEKQQDRRSGPRQAKTLVGSQHWAQKPKKARAQSG